MDPCKLYYVYRCFDDPANHYWMAQNPKCVPSSNVQQHHTFVLRSCDNPCGWLERVDLRLRNSIIQKVEGTDGFRAQLKLDDPHLLVRMMVDQMESSDD